MSKKEIDFVAAARRAKLKVEHSREPIIPPYDTWVLGSKVIDIRSGDVLFIHHGKDVRRFRVAFVSFHKAYEWRFGRVIKYDLSLLDREAVRVVRFATRLPEEIGAACSFASWALLNYPEPKRFRRTMTPAGFVTRCIERMGFVPVGKPYRVRVDDLIEWLKP